MNSFLSAAAVSAEIAAMIEQTRASVTQVQSGGRGIGTGVIWRSNEARSEILTNAHVVAGAERRNGHGANRTVIRVVTSDKREFDAKVTASNPQLDLAMLSVEVGNLPPAKIGDSTRLRVGELAFAIGNPWGQVGVVTSGVVSGSGSIEIRGTDRTAQYIRSDVLLAPGNSGGPLINAEGTVIGINAMIFGGDLSVAIPSHVAVEWIAGQPDNPVRLGIGVQVVRLPSKQEGLLVVNVEPDGAAARDLLVGDVVLGVFGEPVTDPDRFVGAVTRNARMRGYARLNVLRGGVLRDIDVKASSSSS
jgi:serine protease Do